MKQHFSGSIYMKQLSRNERQGTPESFLEISLYIFYLQYLYDIAYKDIYNIY